MHRVTRLTETIGAAGLLVVTGLVALLLIGWSPVAHANGNTIKVPDDHATIQAAVNAASDGDTILIAAGEYYERITVTKGIELSGGWTPGFTATMRGGTMVDAEQMGRAISVTCATSDTLVTIDNFFIVNGNATGLGAPAEPHTATVVGRSLRPNVSRDDRQPSTLLTIGSLRSDMAEMAERDLFPGGASAYEAAMSRLDMHESKARASNSRLAPSSDAPNQVQQDDLGTGGGLYSWNASVHLRNSFFVHNAASLGGRGYGGAVYMGRAAPGKTQIVGNEFVDNVASMNGTAGGGGLFIIHTQGALLQGNTFYGNVATYYGRGIGGGAYIYDASDLEVSGNEFEQNLASDGGDYDSDGVGGGLAIDIAAGADVSGNTFAGNTGAGYWAAAGGAGGLFVNAADGATIGNNVVRANLGTLRGIATGGGIQVQESADVIIESNEIIGNWGMLMQPAESFAGGGGLGLVKVTNGTVRRNTFKENIGSATVALGAEAWGGGAMVSEADGGTVFISNTFEANVAALSASDEGLSIGMGGGARIDTSEGIVVSGNTFIDNAGGLGKADGLAGGLHLRNNRGCEVVGNRIERNLAGAGDGSNGGGLMIDSFYGWGSDAVVDANMILDNRAGPEPDQYGYGGVYLGRLFGDSTITNNVIAGNLAGEAGGVTLDGVQQLTMANNTVSGNTDTGISFDANRVVPEQDITLINNIVAGHTVGLFASEWVTTPITVGYTLLHGNGTDTDGTGDVTYTNHVYGDPAFVDATGGDFHLTGLSAALDAGDPAGVPPAPAKDADGVARPVGAAVDIGAYEYQGSPMWRIFIPIAQGGGM